MSCDMAPQSFQETAAAFKQAADQIRQTSTAFERALLVVELDVPSSVSAFERVCSELESVVRIMNFVTGNIGRKKGKNPALLSSNSKVGRPFKGVSCVQTSG